MRTSAISPRSMAMPTSAAITLFDADLTLAGRVAERLVVVALEDDLAALADQQAVQPRQRPGGAVDGVGAERGHGAAAEHDAEREGDPDDTTAGWAGGAHAPSR